MGTYLWVGTALGVGIGLVHAYHIDRWRKEEGASAGEAAWFALWAVGLWALFGAYVLTFWLLGAAGMAVSRLAGASR